MDNSIKQKVNKNYNIDIERICRIVTVALSISGAGYKQYYLHEIAEELGIPSKGWVNVEQGTAPPL